MLFYICGNNCSECMRGNQKQQSSTVWTISTYYATTVLEKIRKFEKKRYLRNWFHSFSLQKRPIEYIYKGTTWQSVRLNSQPWQALPSNKASRTRQAIELGLYLHVEYVFTAWLRLNRPRPFRATRPRDLHACGINH